MPREEEEAKEEAERAGEGSEDEQGPRRPSRRATAGHVDDLMDYELSEGDESDEEELAVDENELARELEELRREDDLLTNAPGGHVAHPDCGVLYDAEKYELRSCASGKTQSYWWKFTVCFKKHKGQVRCLLCKSSDKGVIGLGAKYQTGNLLRHFKDHHHDEWSKHLQLKAPKDHEGGTALPQPPSRAAFRGGQQKLGQHLEFKGIALQNCHRALAAWIVNDNRPFNLVTSRHFRSFTERISSGRYPVPCPETVTEHELRQLSPDEVEQYNQRHRKREASRQAGIVTAKKARKEAATDFTTTGGGGGCRPSSEREVQVVAVHKPKQGSINSYFTRAAN